MAELLSVQVHVPPNSKLFAEKSSKKSSLDSVNRAGRDRPFDQGTFAQLSKRRAASVEFKDLIYQVREGNRHKGKFPKYSSK